MKPEPFIEFWETPAILSEDFDRDGFSETIEKSVIEPAVRSIVSNRVSEYAASLFPFRSTDKKKSPNPGWDSSVRYNDRMERVFPYWVVLKNSSGFGSEINPEFSKKGILVFSRNNPGDAYSWTVHRDTIPVPFQGNVAGIKIRLTIKVTIKDESKFEAEWFYHE